MTPPQFVEKWSATELSERAASHEHFTDPCRLLAQPTPAEADPQGADYCFEKSVKVIGAASQGSKGEGGFVDVWKRGSFAWEYKRKLEELPGRLEVLRRVFTSPDTFKPEKRTEEVTLERAQEFGDLADALIDRYPPSSLGHLWNQPGSPVAHFLMKVMFCPFAEDIGLLPEKAFTKVINLSLFKPEGFEQEATNLFALMRTGGLFDEAPALPLLHGDLMRLHKVAERSWSGVEPSIFGTLFERILDPDKRAQIGAHYTSKQDIMLVVEPVVMAPLRRKWDELRDKIKPQLDKIKSEKDRKKRSVLAASIGIALEEYRKYLGQQRVLDPACGSGNFLYVALQQLLDLEDEVVRFAANHDIAQNPVPHVRPTQMHGIEINPYAAELAQVVIWIGYLQWLTVHGIENPRRPILDKLEMIENRDAILDFIAAPPAGASTQTPSPVTPRAGAPSTPSPRTRGEGRGEGLREPRPGEAPAEPGRSVALGWAGGSPSHRLAFTPSSSTSLVRGPRLRLCARTRRLRRLGTRAHRDAAT